MSRSTKIFAIVILTLVVVACGGGATPSATTAPSTTASPLATSAPTTAAVATPTQAGPFVVSGAGATPADIQAKVDEYRKLLGDPDNSNAAGSQAAGRREINWDGVPDELAAPNFLPADFFNAPNRARGAILKTPGAGVQVSAKAGNPSGALPRFGHINASYLNIFKTFSAERLFSPIGSNIVDLTFAVPGTNTPALVRGFGAIYTDVDTDHTAFEYFDAAGNSLGQFKTPIFNEGLSFLGVAFPTAVVARVRIAYGTTALGPDDGGAIDVAVMDDFIYGEPQPAPNVAAQPTTAPVTAATPTTASPAAAGGFTQLGDNLNRDKNAAATDPAITVGSLDAGKLGVAWVAWAEKRGSSQQIFVSRQNGAKFDPVAASLNIHPNVVAEKPSVAFAGANRAVPWVAWYEPSPNFGNNKQVFAARFNAASGSFVAAGQNRGSNEPSLNIHTNKPAEDPIIVGGSTDPTKPPSPWVCWQEDSAHHNTVAIFVAHTVADDKALGGFKWQPVGLNRGGTDADPEPNVNLDAEHGDGDHCGIVFAETNNAVPWVIWLEKSGNKPNRIFTARGVADAKAQGGFKWQFVPDCKDISEEAKCVLNVNPTKNADSPFITAGSVLAGQATVPWVVWTEEGPTGKQQVFVNRLDQVSRNKFLNVGGSLNVDQNRDAEAPSLVFVGTVPFVSWSEKVGNVNRIFVRHLASDPQTGTWALDTPKEGLAVDKTKDASYRFLAATPDGKLVFAYQQGDQTKEASQIIVCTNANVSAFLQRVFGMAAPLFAGKVC